MTTSQQISRQGPGNPASVTAPHNTASGLPRLLKGRHSDLHADAGRIRVAVSFELLRTRQCPFFQKTNSLSKGSHRPILHFNSLATSKIQPHLSQEAHEQKCHDLHASRCVQLLKNGSFVPSLWQACKELERVFLGPCMLGDGVVDAFSNL